MKKKMKALAFLSLVLSALFNFSCTPASTEKATIRTIQMVAVEINGTKFWLPSTIIAKKGDLIKIHAVSKIPGQNNIHGLAIDEFKIEGLIDEQGKDLEFLASKAGIFPIRCHLHPAHIGGQLLVVD